MQLKFCMQDAMDVAAAKVAIPGWTAYIWQAREGGSIVTGCVPAGTYTRGARQGLPRFSHPAATARTQVVVSDFDLQQAAQVYEQSGNCWDCKGEGKVVKGWGVTEGIVHETCERCSGTGKI